MRVIVLTFDRLPARLLACYGNEWIETPEFDQLAAQSSVFDRHFVELPGPAGPNHPWWTGTREFFVPTSTDQNVISHLVCNDIPCHLLAETIGGLPVDSFSSSEEVEFEDGLEVDHADTGFARLVTRALEFTSSNKTELLWLHSRGVPSPWLPPRVFADLYLNELEEVEEEEEWDEHTGKPLDDFTTSETSTESEEPSESFDVLGVLDEISENPSLIEALLTETEISDEFEVEHSLPANDLERRISQYIFAGYVSLVDHWLGRLVRGLAEQPQSDQSETVLIVTAASGKESGTRGAFTGTPSDCTETCDELVQTPLLIHRLGDQDFGERFRRFAGPEDLAPTLAALFGVSAKERGLSQSLTSSAIEDDLSPREEVFHLSPSGEIAIRTTEWLLVVPESGLLRSEPLEEKDDLLFEAKLFALPEDQWQINNVASRRRDVVIDLAVKLQAQLRAAGRL